MSPAYVGRLAAFARWSAKALPSNKSLKLHRESADGTSEAPSTFLPESPRISLRDIYGPVHPASHSNGKTAVLVPAATEVENNPQEPAAGHETELTGSLRTPASEHDCKIMSLSSGGMKIVAPCAVVSLREQVVVETQKFPPFSGVVSWTQGSEFEIQFARPVSAETLDGIAKLTRRVRTPRAHRVELELPSIVYFNGVRHDVVIRNISAGGMMMTSRAPFSRGQRRFVQPGQALMIQFPELLPFGGHVRWVCGGKCGVMFSKLLSVPVAVEVARIAELSSAFVDDVRLVHLDLEHRP